MTNILEIKNLTKKYHTKKGETLAIKDISLDIKEGEIIGIVGSSGCGKSTLLNILAGLDNASSGSITNHNLKEAYMLQNDALLPWLNVLDNACIGLKIMNIKTKENIEYVKSLLKNFGLENFLEEYPNNLSGGMKQRVA
jgi:NitT/TauT family transport system ATP-binding protein